MTVNEATNQNEAANAVVPRVQLLPLPRALVTNDTETDTGDLMMMSVIEVNVLTVVLTEMNVTIVVLIEMNVTIVALTVALIEMNATMLVIVVLTETTTEAAIIETMTETAVVETNPVKVIVTIVVTLVTLVIMTLVILVILVIIVDLDITTRVIIANLLLPYKSPLIASPVSVPGTVLHPVHSKNDPDTCATGTLRRPVSNASPLTRPKPRDSFHPRETWPRAPITCPPASTQLAWPCCSC